MRPRLRIVLVEDHPLVRDAVRGVLDGESSRPHFTPYLVPVGGPLT